MESVIVTNPAERPSWSPSWRDNDPDKPVYYFRAGPITERGMMEAEITAEYGGGRVYDFELREAFERGVDHLLADDPEGAARVKAINAQADADDLPADEAAFLAEVRRVLALHWPDYKALLGQAARRAEMSPIVAFQRYCVGWEGGGLPPFARGPDGRVKLELLGPAHVPALELKIGGTFAYNLQYAAGAEKNSAAPLKSGGARRTSASARPARAGGGSAGKSGRKTR